MFEPLEDRNMPSHFSLVAPVALTKFEDEPIYGAAEGATLGVVYQDPNAEGQLTFTVSNLPQGITFNSETREFTGAAVRTTVPRHGQPRTFDVLITATDVTGESESVTWSLTIQDNTFEIVSSPSDRTDAEGTRLDWFSGIHVETTTTGPNFSGPLLFSADGLPPDLELTGDSIQGKLSYSIADTNTPSVAFLVTITVTDPVTNDAESRTFTWTVTDTNRIATVENSTNHEGDTIGLYIPYIADPTGVSVRVSGLPEGLSATDYGQGIWISGQVSFTNVSSDETSRDFPITMTLSDGASIDIRTFTWTIVNTSADLRPQPDLVQTEENQVVTFNILANDTWSLLNATPEIRVEFGSLPQHGTLVADEDLGSYSYTPEENYLGLDGFSYRLYDQVSDTYSRWTWATIAVTRAGLLAVDDYFTIPHDHSLNFTVDDLRANDIYPADGQVPSVTIDASDVTQNADGSYAYTPPEHWTGTYAFTYWLALGENRVQATVYIEVYNTPPQPGNDYYAVLHDRELRIAKSELLQNDRDLDGDGLQIISVSRPQYADSFEVLEDGTIRYVPRVGWTGMDCFTYQVSDGVSQLEGKVYIGVHNDPPIAEGEMFTLEPGESFAIFDGPIPDNYQGGRATNWAQLLANDSDPNGDLLTLQLVSDALSNNPAWHRDDELGAWIYTASTGNPSTDTGFRYYVTDRVPVTPYSPTYLAGSPVSASWIVTVTFFVLSNESGDADNNPPQVKLISVTFLGDDRYLITSDPNGLFAERDQLYDPNQWYDNGPGDEAGNGVINKDQGEHSWPVAYKREAIMEVRAGLNLGQNWTGVLWVRADSPDLDLQFPAQQVEFNNEGQKAVLLTAKQKLPDKVQYYDSFAIRWYVSFDNQNWNLFGTSKNQLYVLWGKPLIGQLYHTVVHLGTEAAKNESEPQKVFDRIWQVFTSRSVKKLGGQKALTYYGSLDLGIGTRGLLVHGNGDCEGWTIFFMDVIGAQGIPNVKQVGIFNRDDKSVQIEDSGNREHLRIRVKSADGSYQLLVKNVNFGDLVPPANLGLPPDPQGYAYYVGLQLVPLDPNNPQGPRKPRGAQGSIPGQGGSPLLQMFSNHTIVKYADKYYDPSYGQMFNSAEEWEQKALAGVAKAFSVGNIIIMGGKEKRPNQRLTWFTDEPRAGN
jgi:hypothetical protein